MIALIQRVKSASVTVDRQLIAEIDQGLLVLLGVERDDGRSEADKLIKKVTNYRVFTDSDGKMNLSLGDIAGQLLVVSQFTLAAETKKGLRPGFSTAAEPQKAQELYQYFVDGCKRLDFDTAVGEFGADMQVALVNDGPVTFSLTT